MLHCDRDRHRTVNPRQVFHKHGQLGVDDSPCAGRMSRVEIRQRPSLPSRTRLLWMINGELLDSHPCDGTWC